MKKVFWSMLLLFTITAHGWAQYNITGTVREKNSGQALSGASVGIVGQYLGTVSNPSGEFILKNIKQGSYTLKVTYVGYSDFTKEIELDKDLSLTIELEKRTILQDEVIISATRAAENEPSTFTNVDKQEISSINFGQDLPYLLSSTPSVVVSSDAGNGIGYTSMRIRGTDISRINVTMNGVPVNDAESQSVFWVDLPDFASSVDNVQIQRGVGTSTNGAAAFGASINFQTTKLNPSAYADYNLSYGSFNTWKNTLSAGTGLLAGHWAVDVRLSKLNSEGYIERAASDLKSMFISGGYYGEKTIVKAIITSGKEKTYQAWNGVPKDSLKTNRRYNPFTYENQTDNYQQDNYQLLASQEIGKHFLINAAAHYTYGRGYYEEFEEYSPFASYGLPDVINGIDTLTAADLVRQKWMNNHFYGATFSGTYDNKKNLKIIVGGAGNQYSGDHFGDIIRCNYLNITEHPYRWHENNTKKNEFNIFTKVNLTIKKKVFLYADLQYRTVKFVLDGIDSKLRDVSQTHIFHFFNPKLGVTYNINDRHSMYLALALSNREPNGNNFADADPAGPAPVRENMFNTELGYTFSSKYVTASCNGYFMYYHDQLVLTGEINDVGYAIMSNVPRSYRAGIELSGAARLFKRLTWELNAGFSQNKIINFTEFVDDWDNGGQIQNQLGNTNIAFSPAITAVNDFTYNFKEHFNISLISRYVSRQYIDNTSDKARSLDPFFVSDLLMEYSFKLGPIKEIRVSLMLNNIFNEKYENNAWVYRYYYNGAYNIMDGYFPQAGINFMTGLKVRL
ncbi:MAG TPA: TonB-dependent receptor [Bacteroidales bacterium]|nr:TonB-dependent receptor [Bacteroidales bacterium]HPI29364.1 TonB-dependent receptor [Bacteroidales bacterium]HQN16540.1 TonB-dependent receptor [Bacteroidales bacterium]HQP15023.1 TonB-dependent receptor [Bacteroidales bacterium]